MLMSSILPYIQLLAIVPLLHDIQGGDPPACKAETCLTWLHAPTRERPHAQVLALARSLFENTDAVVRADSVRQGMQRMLSTELPWVEERKQRARQLVCWYASMALNVNKTALENLAVLQRHLDALSLHQRLVL